MGVGGNFWDALKPYARYEGFDFIRNKKVAVDLSLWIVQHETALKSSRVRNPHLRLTFLRTINLFSKFGAYPVFVVDGKPSHLKSKARIARYFRSSGIDPKDMPVVEEGISVDRNKFFVKCVEECVDLLKYLGMPFFRARGEAEALCAQLNSEGAVDACITSDSDALLFGAKCVIKHVDPKSTRPFECYYVEDIEVGLGLGRKHLIAVSLLVGSDHNINGVQGIGMETALRFVKKYNEDEVLQRLSEIGSGHMFPSNANFGSPGKCTRNSDMLLQKSKAPHCSFCGHPGNKSLHSRVPCEYCHSITGVNCSKKPPKFKCVCSSCDRERKEKELKKNENFHFRVCKKIAMECNFPCKEIIEIYLRSEDIAEYSADLLWNEPDIEMLIDFLAYHLHWEPSYIRQQIFPMLSTIFLRDMALHPSELLLLEQYKFDSIQRLKIRYGHQYYVVMWRRFASSMSDANYSIPSEGYSIISASESEETQMDGTCNGLDELRVPQIHVDGESSFILTDENVELVQAAFPAEVDNFLQQKEVKESKRKVSRSRGTCIESPSSHSGGVQLAITDYYRSSKPLNQAKDYQNLAQSEETGCLKEKKKASSPSLSKSTSLPLHLIRFKIVIASNTPKTVQTSKDKEIQYYQFRVTGDQVVMMNSNSAQVSEEEDKCYGQIEVLKNWGFCHQAPLLGFRSCRLWGFRVSSVFRLVTEYSISLSLSSIPLQFQGNIINESIIFHNLSLQGSMDTERYPNICILLVDPDPRSSQNTLALLVNSNYRVVTACQGADALETLEKKKRKVDLVLMPTKLPDMCSFEVLDILQIKYKMAVVMLFDTDQPCAKAEYVRNGAMFCYVKPLDSRIAATLWQHAFVKEVELFRQSRRSPISGVTFNGSEIHVAKRKFQGSSSFTWTPYMENIFLGIVHGLGVYDADPLEVLRRMHVPGLTLDVLIDKLQEYQVRQTFLDHSITVSPTPVCIIALNSRSQLMGQNIYTNPGQAFAHEQGYPGFLQNPRQDQLNRARAYEMPTLPLALVNSVPYLPHVPNMSQLPQASVPPANTAQRLILPPWPPTLTYLPSSSVAPPAPGHGEDESKLGG